jgi:hypothetical protein
MSDYNSRLPVRTEANGDVVVNVADGTTESQLLGIDSSGRVTVKLDDGNGNVVTSQANGSQRALDVGINVSGVQIDPRQIRALTAADIVTSNQGTAASTHAGYWWTRTTDGTNDVVLAPASTAATASQAALVVALSPNSPLPAGTNLLGSINQGTSPWIVKDLADGSVTGGTAGTYSMLVGGVYSSSLPTLTTGQQAAIQLDSSGRVLVGSIFSPLPAGTNILGKIEISDGTNVSGVAPASTAASATQPALVVGLSPNSPLPAGTNALGSVLANLQVANAPVTVANPVPVTITSASAGTPIQYYATSASLAAGSSATITYTVPTGHTFSLERIWATASGKIKIVVQSGSTTIFTGFNSTASPNIDLTVTAPPTIAAAGTVNVIITNEDKAAFDVYATIEGNQLT